jgi:serine phosphatase RsbU (regulator of sigma subunit)
MKVIDPHSVLPAVDLKLSPFRMLLVLMGSVFCIELAVMFAFEVLPPISILYLNILDASILVSFLFPTLYLSVYRPLTRLIDRHVLMEKELVKHRDHLEELVAERTEQVNQYVKAHEEEDAMAAYVMGRYLDASQYDPRVEYSVLSASHHFSGDAISVTKTPDGGLNIMMVDAMGHGLAAAINVLPAIQAFFSMSRKGLALTSIVHEINNKVRELSPQGRFLAATFINLDATHTTLTGWIGGAPQAYLKNENEILIFKSCNLSLGIVPSDKIGLEFFSAPWSEHSILVTCTDGILESQGQDGKELGDEWMYDITLKYGCELNNTLFSELWRNSLGDNLPHDDASILIVNQTLAV